ncbi:hypothetical protein [Streptomyces fradiae]|uniref:hypothetical protein n=1 Tax=Streptomyces fradiae TaxID=1906 RepID=UPI003517E103
MSIVVTAGQPGDSPRSNQCWKVRVPRIGPGRPRVRPDRVRADKAYASRKNRAYLRRRGIRCAIPDKADQGHSAGSEALTVAGHRDSPPGRLPRASCGRVRDQPPQETPRRRHRYEKLAVRYGPQPLIDGRYEVTALVAAINEWL